MTMLKRVFAAQISALGPDQVEVVMSTGTIARDGHILVPQGAVLDNYRANPIVLWQHDPDFPVGNASNIRIGANSIAATITFAPTGISAKADEVRGLVKSGVVSSVSVGFDPQDGEPLDPKKPRGGQRFTQWELLECSFVSVPADTGAIVTARELERTQMTEQNHAATEAEARAAEIAAVREELNLNVAPKKRGMYGIAQLAYALDSLGWVKECADFETAYEGDESEVPGLILDAIKAGCTALMAMTVEECAELIAGDDDDPDDGADAGERYLRSAEDVRQRLTRDDGGDGGGEETMSAHVAAIREGLAHLDSAIDVGRASLRAHRRCAAVMRAAIEPEAPAEGDGVDPEDAGRAALVASIRRLKVKGELARLAANDNEAVTLADAQAQADAA